MPVTKSDFGTHDGKPVHKFVLDNGTVKVELISYGAAIRSIFVPDKDGKVDDIVLGFDDMGGYRSKNPYFGAVVGRVANRIGQGTFKLDGKKYQLEKNNGENALHGGVKAFDKMIWNAHIPDDKVNSVNFGYLSPDGENGYPGSLVVNVTYTLSDDNQLSVEYKALTDLATPVNLTNHSYFNLGGHSAGKTALENHEVQMWAEKWTPVNEFLIPTGQIQSVIDTPFDLRKRSKLGPAICKAGTGFDHNFCVSEKGGIQDGLKLVSTVWGPGNGRRLEVRSNQPGVQFYTGNFLPKEDGIVGKSGAEYKLHGGFCLETQNYPDAINKPAFPACVVRPGQMYDHKTIFKFAVDP